MPSSPSRPSVRRVLTAVTAALVAVLALLAASTTPAHAATTTPVYAGTGWKAETADYSIYSLAPGPYTIVFADSTARTKLAPYFTKPASQVTSSVGVPITVTTTIDTTPAVSCPAKGRIVVHYQYRPTGTAGLSQALPCHNTADGSAWGGHILMDSDYWTSTNWFAATTSLNEAYRRNAVTHEFGHILGLDHPNIDLDKDGRVEAFECPKNSSGWTPVLCSPNGGNRTATYSGSFVTVFDLAGLKQLAANFYLRAT
ncbi:hypothetical protein [Streptomyces sp. NPDC058295]|uniref:hypothetical protein n=1 Tax=Streptomyces sp. NPDC058295 TaxID=3346431 RepID=UPI0036E7F970